MGILEILGSGRASTVVGSTLHAAAFVFFRLVAIKCLLREQSQLDLMVGSVTPVHSPSQTLMYTLFLGTAETKKGVGLG